MGKFIFTIGFPLYLALVLLDLNEFFSAYFDSGRVLSQVILALSTFLIIAAKPVQYRTRGIHVAFLVFFWSYIICATLACLVLGKIDQIEDGIRAHIPSFFIYLAAYRTTLSARSLDELYNIFKFVSGLICINAALIVVSIIFGIDFHDKLSDSDTVDRAVGLYGNPNRAGYVSVIGQGVALTILISGRTRKHHVFFAAYFLCVVSAICTFSKGAIILSTVVFLGVIVIGPLGKSGAVAKRFRKYSKIITLVLVASTITTFSSKGIYYKLSALQGERIEEVQMLLVGQLNTDTTSKRSVLFRQGLNEIKTNSFFGAGFGRFRRMADGRGVHNMYLLILGEAGIVSLAAYLIFLICWFIESRIRRTINPILLSSQCLLLVVIFTGVTSQTGLTNKSLIIVMGIVFAAVTAVKGRSRKTEPEGLL